MSQVNQLKNKARREEQRENWSRAIEFYTKALDASRAEDESFADLSLYNRIGDIYLRIGQKNTAVRYYEQAIERYSAQDLHTSAIALCNKVLRILPDRSTIFLQLGRLHLETNLIADAREHFHRYATAMRERGGAAAGYEALEELIRRTGDRPTLSLWMSWLSEESDEAVVGERIAAARDALDDQGIDADEVLERVKRGDASGFETGPTAMSQEDPFANAFLSMPDGYGGPAASGGRTESSPAESPDPVGDEPPEGAEAEARRAVLEAMHVLPEDLELGSAKWNDERRESDVAPSAPLDVDHKEAVDPDEVEDWVGRGLDLPQDLTTSAEGLEGLDAAWTPDVGEALGFEAPEAPGPEAGEASEPPGLEELEDEVDFGPTPGAVPRRERPEPPSDVPADASPVLETASIEGLAVPLEALHQRPELGASGPESTELEADQRTGRFESGVAAREPLETAGEEARHVVPGETEPSEAAPLCERGLVSPPASPPGELDGPEAGAPEAVALTAAAGHPTETSETAQIVAPRVPPTAAAAAVELEPQAGAVALPQVRPSEPIEPRSWSVAAPGVGRPATLDPTEDPISSVGVARSGAAVEIPETDQGVGYHAPPFLPPDPDDSEPDDPNDGNWVADAYEEIERVMSATAEAAAARAAAAQLAAARELATPEPAEVEATPSGAGVAEAGSPETERIGDEESSTEAVRADEDPEPPIDPEPNDPVAVASAEPTQLGEVPAETVATEAEPVETEAEPVETEAEAVEIEPEAVVMEAEIVPEPETATFLEDEAAEIEAQATALEAETVALEVPHQLETRETESDRNAASPPAEAEPPAEAAPEAAEPPPSKITASPSRSEPEVLPPLAEPRFTVEEDPEEAFSDWVESASNGVLRRALPELTGRNEREKALLVIARLSELERHDVEYRRKHVDALEELGRTEAAIEACVTLAVALEEFGRPIEAREAFGRVLALAPGDDRARAGLQRLESILEGDGAAESDGHRPYTPSHVSIGEPTMIATHDQTSSSTTNDLDTIRRAPSGPPRRGAADDGTRPYSGVAGGAEAASDFEALLSEFRAELSEKPTVSDSMSRTEYGANLKEMGRLDDAIRELQAAVREPSPPPLAYELLGEAFLEKGQSRIAMRLLEKALGTLGHTDREMLGILYQLGVTYEGLNDPKNALLCYERIFSVDIDYRDVQDRILTCST